MAACRAAMAEREEALESANAANATAIESVKAEMEAALVSTTAESTAALQAARARIESHEEDKASLSAHLAASTAQVAELMGLVSVVHREPDL